MDDRGIDGIRCALTLRQVSEYELPYSPDAIKEGDTRTRSYREWLADQGFPTDMAVELDALPPATLKDLVRDSIEENLDLDRLEEEREIETSEELQLEEIRESVEHILDGWSVNDGGRR